MTQASAQAPPAFSSFRSEATVGGRKVEVTRYLVSSLDGYFPVLARTGPNALAIIFRTGGPHIAISGTVATATSADGGRSWSDSIRVAPRFHDFRNPAFGVNARGELLAAFWQARDTIYRADPEQGPVYDEVPVAKRPAGGTMFFCRSANGGKTWTRLKSYLSANLHPSVESPYGRIIQLKDGTLAMPLYGSGKDGGTDDVSAMVRSRDGGRSWGDETVIARGWNETSVLELPNGDLLAALRRADSTALVGIARSSDGGRTWSEPQPVTRPMQHPADLTLLQDGRVLMTFGRRIGGEPMGCGLLLSSDGGKSWDTTREIVLAGDSGGGDCGYPSTVQMDDGTLVTALYYANGSAGSKRWWGDVTCQVIRYRVEDLR